MSNCAQKYCAVHVLPSKCLLTCWKVAWTRLAGNMLLRKIILRSVNVVQWIANVNMIQKKRHTYFPKYLSFIVTNTNTMQTSWVRKRLTQSHWFKGDVYCAFSGSEFFFNLHQLSHAVHCSLPPSKTLSFRSCLCNFFCSLKNSNPSYIFVFIVFFPHHINLHLLPLASIQYIQINEGW